jgi:hypothetical protein
MPIRNTDLKRVGKDRLQVKSPSGKVHAKSTTLKKAKAQQRLLNAIAHGWVPGEETPSGKRRSERRRKPRTRTRSKRSQAIAESKARKRHRYKPMFDYSPRLIKGLMARSSGPRGRRQ